MIGKRFEIVKSKLIKDGWVISDKLKQFTFPTLKGDKRALVSYCKVLNELHEENDVLKQELKTKAIVNRQYEELQTFKKENEQLKKRLAEREKMLDVRDKIIGDVSKALNGDLK